MADDERPIIDESSRDVGALLRLTGVLVLVLLFAAFAIDNRSSVRVGWVLGDSRAPLIVVLLVTALVGALIGWLVLSIARRSPRPSPPRRLTPDRIRWAGPRTRRSARRSARPSPR